METSVQKYEPIETVQVASPRPLIPQSLSEYMEMARQIASSELVPSAYRGKPEDCMVAMQYGAEVGMKPLQSLQYIAVIKGKPTMFGDAAIALCRSKSDWDESGFEEGVDQVGNELVGYCQVQRKGGRPHRQEFSQKDAVVAGLWGNAGPWRQHPKRMLILRARAFALRTIFAHHLLGLSIYEEVADYDVQVEDVVPDERPAKRTTRVKERLAQRKQQVKQPPPEDAVVTTEEPFPADAPPPEPPKKGMALAQRAAMLLKDVGFSKPEDYRVMAAYIAGVEKIESVKDLTESQIKFVIDALEYLKEAMGPRGHEVLTYAYAGGLSCDSSGEMDDVITIFKAEETRAKAKRKKSKKSPGEQSELLLKPKDEDEEDITDDLRDDDDAA